MIHLVTYADENMSQSAILCASSAKKHGIDKVWSQNPDTISDEFKHINKDIFKEGARGAGCYWLFKPYFTYKAMIQPCVNDGDYVIWCDAGVEWVNNVRYIIDRMDEDIFFFSNGHRHIEWCKWDVIWDIITGVTEEVKQVQASVIVFKVNDKTKSFAKEWLLRCQMPGFIDDSPSNIPNFPTFAEHRHDQAIITCLQIKYGYKQHFWPTNYSEHIRHTAQPGDDYPTLFNHHRKRNTGMGKGDAEW